MIRGVVLYIVQPPLAGPKCLLAANFRTSESVLLMLVLVVYLWKW